MSSNSPRNARLRKELKNFDDKTSDNVSASPIDDDIAHWQAIIIGPADTPYANQIMNLDIKFPEDYPFKPPKIKFIQPIWHPNVSKSNGDICLDILKSNWSPALGILQVLISISSLLEDPNPDDPLNSSAAEEYKNNKTKFTESVMKYFNKQW